MNLDLTEEEIALIKRSLRQSAEVGQSAYAAIYDKIRRQEIVSKLKRKSDEPSEASTEEELHP